jgi:hypothetical protein
MKNRPEEDLQKAAVALLTATLTDEVFFFHVPNQKGTRSTFESRLLKALGVKPGVADLIFLFDGRMYAMELKAPRAYQSPAQKQFEAACKKINVPYEICRSLEEVQGVVNGWGFPKRGRIAV